MITYLLVSIISGILFGVMDGLINANSLAQRLYSVFKSITKTSLNIPAGIIIDLIFGFVMAGIFLILYNSLPSDIGVVKGISFAFLAWFFRVVMSVASQWMMYTVPLRALLYNLFTGFGEMLALGTLYGLTLAP